MIRILSALALGAMTTLAMAEPVTLTDAQMDQVVAGSSNNFPPGQNPAGNPAKAPGNSNPNEHPKK
jgi:hypothetical protein